MTALKWTLLVVLFLSLLAHIWQTSKHGERRDPYNGFEATISACVEVALIVWILAVWQ